MSLISMNSIVELQNMQKSFNIALDKKGFGNFAKNGKKVTIEYTATTFNGTVVDDSQRHANEKGQTIIEVGKAEVTECMDEALRNMSEGAAGTITCPADMAYGTKMIMPNGPKGLGSISPNSTITYKLKVVRIPIIDFLI